MKNQMSIDKDILDLKIIEDELNIKWVVNEQGGN